MDKEYAVSAKSQELILNPNVLYREVVEKLKCIWRLEHDITGHNVRVKKRKSVFG